MIIELKRVKKDLSEYDIVKDNEIFISASDWRNILEDFNKEDIISFLSDKIDLLPYPFTKYQEQEIKKDWISIKYDNMEYSLGYWEMPKVNIKSTRMYGGKNIFFDFNNKGLKVSNSKTEFARVEVDHPCYKRATIQWSREGMKNNRRKFLSYFFNICTTKGIDSKLLRTAISSNCYIASQFKPAVAKAIYNFFDHKKVLDFSSGWGDRLVGFNASNAQSYIGIDPNTKLHPHYESIHKYCDTGKEAKFICLPAEDVDYSELDYDFAFTSPPYFNTEKYSDEETQSWKRYPKLDLWLNGFLFSTLEKIYEGLNEGGRIAVNISDRYRDGIVICQPMIEYMESLGAYYEGVIGYRMGYRMGDTGKVKRTKVFCEPIFIWSKGEAPEPKWNQDNFFGV